MSEDPTERAREFVAASRAHDATTTRPHAAPQPHVHGPWRARSLVAKALARLRAYFQHPAR